MKNDDWTQQINIAIPIWNGFFFYIAALTIMKLKYELDVQFYDLFKILKFIYLLFFSNIKKISYICSNSKQVEIFTDTLLYNILTGILNSYNNLTDIRNSYNKPNS